MFQMLPVPKPSMDPGTMPQRGTDTAPVDAELLSAAIYIQGELNRAIDNQTQIGDLYFKALRKTKPCQLPMLPLPIYYQDLDLSLSKFIADKFSNDDEDDSALCRFLRVCHEGDTPAAGVLVSLLVGKDHRAGHLIRRLGSQSYWDMLVFTVHLAKWRCVLELLRSQFDSYVSRDSPVVESGLTAWVLKTAGGMSWRDSLALQVVEFLLPRCEDRSALVAVFDCALAHGACALVEVFTERDVFDLDRLELPYTKCWWLTSRTVLETAIRNLLESPGTAAYAQIVVKLIRAGVSPGQASLHAALQHTRTSVLGQYPGLFSTDRRPRSFLDHSPVVCALVHGRGDLVSLLFRTGATTPAELDFIRTWFSAGIVDRTISALGTDRARVTAVRTQLLEESLGPRSLQNLCLSTVSRSLGCRADRGKIIGNLRLPETFKRCLRFDGEVGDFEKCFEEMTAAEQLRRRLRHMVPTSSRVWL